MKSNSTTSSGHGRRAHVIVVHPDSAARELLGSCLGDEVRVTLCANLGEGSERCMTDPPDVLVVAPAAVNGELQQLLPKLHQIRRSAALVLLAEPEAVVAAAEQVASDVIVVDKLCSPEMIRRSIRQGLLQAA